MRPNQETSHEHSAHSARPAHVQGRRPCDTVYLAGQVADKAAGKSVAEQTTEILGIIDGLLAAAGTDKTKLLMVNIWLSDMSTFAEMNSVWDTWVVRRDARPRHGRGEARRAAVHGRDRGHCRQMIDRDVTGRY